MYNEKAIKYYEEGRTLHQQGKLSAAERTYKKALKADQNFFEAYSNLGNVLVDRGRLREASGAYRKALQISPNHPLLLNNLGNVLQLQGENKKAISWLNKAIAQDSNYADAYYNLGNALRGTGNLEEAINSYKQAIKNNPGHVEAYVNVGILLYELDKLDEAIANLKKATEVDPNHIEANYELGNAQCLRSEPGNAIASYNRVLEIDPGHTATYLGLGNAFKLLPQWDKAIDSYQQAIALEPEFASAYLALSTVRKFEQNEKIIETMERLYKKQDLSPDSLMCLCFALGKAHDDLANYDEACAYIEQGNQLKWDLLDFDVESVISYFEQLEAAFQPDIFTGFDKGKATEIKPVFIIGMPRSGKTLAETMLARHPLVCAAGERDSLKETLNDAGDLRNPGSLVKHLLNLSSDGISKLAQNYTSQVRLASEGESFIVDTMPMNFQYIGFIKLLFPNAKVIHCYRDPIDACWFIHQKCFRRQNYIYSSDLASLAAYYRGYSDLMAHWHEVLPGYIHDLQYERLITDTQQEMSRLVSFLGLEWHGEYLDRYENEALHHHSIGVWRHYEKYLGPLIKALG